MPDHDERHLELFGILFWLLPMYPSYQRGWVDTSEEGFWPISPHKCPAYGSDLPTDRPPCPHFIIEVTSPSTCPIPASKSYSFNPRRSDLIIGFCPITLNETV